MGYNYYPQNPDWNDAAVLLNLMSPDQITKVITLINARGPQVITDIKMRQRSASAMSPLVILDTKYVPSEDLEDVALGLSTVLVSLIRRPATDQDSYEKILKTAFGLPQDLAAKAAKNIETADILGGSYKDEQGNELPWYTSYALKIKDAVRKAVNALPFANYLGWEIDPTQKYDLDLLYEYKLLGATVREFNSRSRLMAGQAALNADTGLFAMGDVEGGSEGDVESQVGDAIRLASLRRVPGEMFGGMKGLGALAANSQQAAAEWLKAKASGNTPAGLSIKRAMVGKPSGFLMRKLRGDVDSQAMETGDLYGDAYSTISANYGSNPAVAWQMGDVEGFLKSVGAIASDEPSTGDPDLDSAIEQTVMEEISGDVEDMTPEMGGLFTRMRINAAKRRAARRGRAGARKGARQARRTMKNQQLINSKRSAASAGWDADYEYDTPADEDLPVDESIDNSEDGNEPLPFPEV